MPRGFKDRVCKAIQFGFGANPPDPGIGGRACAPHPRIFNPAEREFDSKTGILYLADHHNHDLRMPRQQPEPGNTLTGATRETLDDASYTLSRLVPTLNASGSFDLVEKFLPDGLTRQVNNGSNNRDGLDLYGDGLSDAFGLEGCRYTWPDFPAASCSLPFAETPTPDSEVRGLFFANHGAGLTTGFANGTPEMLRSVSDAWGMQARWTYDALSSKAGRQAGQLPLYRVPLRFAVGGYVDARHFYFTSSMNVVAQFEQRNGLGTAMNATRYGYEEAMFNVSWRNGADGSVREPRGRWSMLGRRKRRRCQPARARGFGRSVVKLWSKSFGWSFFEI